MLSACHRAWFQRLLLCLQKRLHWQGKLRGIMKHLWINTISFKFYGSRTQRCIELCTITLRQLLILKILFLRKQCIQRKSISIRTILNKRHFLCLQKFLPGQSPGERQWRGDQHCTAQQDGSQLQKTSHPPKQNANHKNIHLNRNTITRNRASHCETHLLVILVHRCHKIIYLKDLFFKALFILFAIYIHWAHKIALKSVFDLK